MRPGRAIHESCSGRTVLFLMLRGRAILPPVKAYRVDTCTEEVAGLARSRAAGKKTAAAISRSGKTSGKFRPVGMTILR
jgi:hypothetical protein